MLIAEGHLLAEPAAQICCRVAGERLAHILEQMFHKNKNNTLRQHGSGFILSTHLYLKD